MNRWKDRERHAICGKDYAILHADRCTITHWYCEALSTVALYLPRMQDSEHILMREGRSRR